ncbi:MAG: hypothetical protein GC168_19875 [Candidatus Hydrogenedens sp.]|nr:hypothetical protein [Candidatus Hydrogenedens sp.]
MAKIRPFTWKRFMSRWLFGFFLIASTYNPSGYSYFHWLTSNDGSFLSLKIAVGLVFVWIYVALWPMVYTGIGPVGIFNTIAWSTAFSLVLWDYGLLDYVSPSFYPYGVIATIATVIAIGLAFSHLQLQFWAVKNVRKVAPKRY